MRNLILGGLILLCAILAVSSVVFSGPARQVSLATADLFAPALGAISSASRETERILGDLFGLLNEEGITERLQTLESRSRYWQDRARELEVENAELRRQLDVTQASNHTIVTARIIGGPTGPFAHSVIIDAGAINGLREGSTVTSGRYLVGRIIGVGERASRVLLLTDPNSRVPVRIGPGGTRAILTGDGTDFPLLQLPSDREQLETDGRVVTSGTGGVFARDVPVGHVEAATGRVRLAAGPGTSLNFVRILLPPIPHQLPEPGLVLPNLNETIPQGTIPAHKLRDEPGTALGAQATGIPAPRKLQ